MRKNSIICLLIFLATSNPSVCQTEIGTIPNTKQFVILKADDLIYDEKNIISKNWYRFFEYMVSEKIKTSVGLIINSLDTEDDRYSGLLKYLVKTGFVELWIHGYDHRLGALHPNGELYD